MRDSFGSLWKSRKFLLLLLDTVVSLATFFIGKYVNPASAQDLLFFIATIQPVFVTLIASIAYEDGQEKGATVFYQEPAEDCPPPGQ